MVSKTFRDVCLVENRADGKDGIQVTAYDGNGKAFATGGAFKRVGKFWDSYLDNMNDLLSAGGPVVGDSKTLGNGKFGATNKDDGIKLDISKGTCEVTTVDAGENANKPVQLGVVLKDVPISTVPAASGPAPGR